MTRHRGVVPLLLLLLCVLLFAWESRAIQPQVDDAYISYRYAQNLVEGHGLVFNMGERVEGFTNLLWTLLIAAGIALGFAPELVAHVLGFASGCALLAASYMYTAEMLPADKRGLAGLAPWVVLLSNSFASWTTSGLETPLFAALGVAALTAQVRARMGWATTFCVLATLTRPEGGLIAAVVIGGELLSRAYEARSSLGTLRAWMPSLVYAAALLLLSLSRWFYYADIVPNTFYAKVGGVAPLSGLLYVLSFLADGPGLLLLPFASALQRSFRIGVLYLVAFTSYVIAVGGDHFQNGRFLLPVLPVLAAGGIAGAWAALQRGRRAAWLWAACIPLAAGWGLYGPTLGNATATELGSVKRAHGRDMNLLPDAFVRRQVERVLQARPRVRLVAHTAIGRFGYYSRLPMLDLLGLVDRHVARSRGGEGGFRLAGHLRSDADYVFIRGPDIIFIPKPGRSPLRLPAVTELWDDPRLAERYRWDQQIAGYRRIGGAVTPEPTAELEPAPAFLRYSQAASAGRWRLFRTQRFDATLSDEQRRKIVELESIGYLDGSQQAPEDRGVVLHLPESTQRGYNLYASGHAPEALLIDMEGRELARWHFDFWQAWPEYPIERDHAMTEFWRRVHLLPDGELLAIHEGLGLLKLDRHSELVWARPNRAHHDLDVRPNGDIYVLAREARVLPRLHSDEPILEDFLLVLDAEGREQQRVSLIEAFEGTDFEDLVMPFLALGGDVFHTNSLTVLEGRAAHRHPAFRAGNVLTYLLVPGVIAVVDLESEKVVWARREKHNLKHDPTIVAEGNLLIFDNQVGDERSQVVEYDALSQRERWRYPGEGAPELHSPTCGTAERLANGNTLITESDAGRAIEVTPDGEVVWAFVNPHRAGPQDRFIATLFEVVRLPPDFPLGPQAAQPGPD